MRENLKPENFKPQNYNNPYKKNQKEEQIKMVNFFDLEEKDLTVLNPYNFDEAIKRLESLTLNDVENDLKDFADKDFEFRNYEDDTSFTINEIKILTSKLSEKEIDKAKEDKEEDINEGKERNREKKNTYILLHSFSVNSEYIMNPNHQSHKEDSEITFPIRLKIENKEGGKKEITIKCLVNPKKIEENIIECFINKSSFKSAKEALEKYEKNKQFFENEEDKYYQLDIKIQANSIDKIHFTKDNEFLLELQFPPTFRSNFLLAIPENLEKSQGYDKSRNKEIYENILFPFRNFKDEISNLKYKRFFILIKKDSDITPGMEEPNGAVGTDYNDTTKDLENSFSKLFKNRSGEIDKNKFIEEKKIEIKNESEIKKEINLKYPEYELSEYFKYKNNSKIKKHLEELRFIQKKKKKQNKENNENEYEYEDEELTKLFYQIVALISEGILSYYNAIEFVELFLFSSKPNYIRKIFKRCLDEDYPTFLNITLTKLLDKFQNSLEEKTLTEFEQEIELIFNDLFDQYENNLVNKEEILRPSINLKLKRIQRCIITPTYILFTPYILDQGNRVVREYISSDNMAMLCVFKMDNLEESRWNNIFLIEYIKFIMFEGFYIGERKFRFFNYSQSQFRNMSCWLLTNPEKVLEKTGNYDKIKIVSKYGARISQTLTTTIKTIKIPKDKIEKIPDIIQFKKKDSQTIKYIFSDGVGKISYNLAEEISKIIKLDYVPSCFQGRFLGCKGVWTTIWEDTNGKIYYRDSQNKFEVKPHDTDNYFELCDYSRYIPSYLNRQVILLLNSLGIKDEIFIKKLNYYKNNLEDNKFVLGLVHYVEWNETLQYMYNCGIDRTNDRLLKSIIESNLELLYNDIKNKARIYIDESAYVIGIMDEYNILEYGQAFLHIKKGDFEITLDKKCAIAKCPCLYPGDIRVLEFKKYIPGQADTKKYEIFNRYENVIIFPSKGERPHPNECSGSDLDGDNYFVFYDTDLIPNKNNLIEAMEYNSSEESEKNKQKVDEKDKITIKDIINFFANYTNKNNLGIIGNAHLALSDSDEIGAMGEKPKKLAKKFARAVDAPKTGEEITLSDDEKVAKYPHYMGKPKNNSYISNKIIGKLYDKTNEIISKISKKKEFFCCFYDKSLKIDSWENFGIIALDFYKTYFNDIISLLKKNEIKGESVLLTGNNIDNEDSIFSKKKHNYDLREKITDDMHEIFIDSNNKFYNAIEEFLKIPEKEKDINFNIKKLSNELYFRNNLNILASSFYMISYNFLEEVINKENSVKNFGKKLNVIIEGKSFKIKEVEKLSFCSEYESKTLGFDFYEYQEEQLEEYYEEKYEEQEFFKNIIQNKVKTLNTFALNSKKYKIPKQANEENQYRILSFPWCIAGKVLSSMKFLSVNKK